MARLAEGTQNRADVLLYPPLCFLLPLALGVVLHYALVPWPLPFAGVANVDPGSLRMSLGALLAVTGLAMALAATARLRAAGNDPMDCKGANSLVRAGVYRYSRNPIYLGAFLISLGLGVAAGSAWIALMAGVGVSLAHYLVVLPEEAYLEREFGESYRRYKGAVRRWV